MRAKRHPNIDKSCHIKETLHASEGRPGKMHGWKDRANVMDS